MQREKSPWRCEIPHPIRLIQKYEQAQRIKGKPKWHSLEFLLSKIRAVKYFVDYLTFAKSSSGLVNQLYMLD